MRERDIHGMNAVRREDIDSSSERRWYRGHENREAPVLQFLNNEGRNESLLNLGKCRLPHVLLILPCHSLSQAPKERVAWYSFEKRLLDALLNRVASGRPDGSPDKKTDNQHEEERE